ncbi:MAG: phosphoribosylglycinamide formyltransferase [Cognatishimia sp.]|uniref:phosphoribosylglycinamide formyltransferase n=1 Tax=Cognatishimia sp. TaxID=2211648 RepID=UPI003B8E8DCA
MKKRVAIFISGGGSNMVRLVEDMQAGGHDAEPVLVLANSADAGGLKKAADLGVPTAYVDHRPFKGDREAFEAALQEKVIAAKPDILCLAGFMRVLTEGFVAPWEGRMLNIHPSILPKYKGLHTHARALEAGDTEHGCTVHLVTPKLDDGPILGQSKVPVLKGDTPDSLAARVLVQEHLLYPAVLRNFAAGNTDMITL